MTQTDGDATAAADDDGGMLLLTMVMMLMMMTMITLPMITAPSRPSWALRRSTSHSPSVFMKHLI